MANTVGGESSVALQEYVKSVIEKEGYVKYKLEKKVVSQAGNFLSFLYEVNITGKTADGEKVTSLFIKKSVTLEKNTLTNVPEVYSRELLLYNELSKIFFNLQDVANIPDKEKFIFLKCYTSDNKVIIMENLSKKGFKTYDGKEVVTIKFAELSIIALAKFHALSYVFKKKAPKYFDSKIAVMKHPFNLSKDWEGFLHNVCVATAQVLNGEVKDKVNKFGPWMIQTYQKYIKDIVPVNGCLCHGDYKVLNILVKEDDGEPIEVKPIDYQLVYYGNPVDDFLFFIFTGTDREFRKKHLNNLKDLYFESFAKFLGLFNLDVNSTYSRQEFDDDYEERLGLGLVFGLHLSAFTFSRPQDGFDIKTRFLSELPIVPDEQFAERVRGIVDDYIDWGYL